MRIKSSFRDYYDKVQSQEKSVLYLREQKETTRSIFHDSKFIFPQFSILHEEFRLTTFIVGFCGKIYPGICHHTYHHISNIADCNLFFYSEEEFTKYIVTKLNPLGQSRYLKASLKNVIKKKYSGYCVWGQKPIKKVFDDIKQQENDFQSFFIQNKCPIFTYQNVYNCHGCTYQDTLTLNARLSDFEFYKLFPPFLTFQELEMYLGNQANPEKPIPPIDDVTMAEAKGFNKFSFRKDPSNKKGKK